MEFPNEILLHIFSWCYVEILWHVCRLWRNLVSRTIPRAELKDYLKKNPKLELIQWVYKHEPDFELVEFADVAIRAHNITLFYLVYDTCPLLSLISLAKKHIKKVALSSIDVEEKYRFIKNSTEKGASKTIETKVVRKLLSHNGFKIVKKLWERVDIVFNENLVLSVVEYRDTKMLDWFRKRGMQIGELAMNIAIGKNDLNTVKWFRKQGLYLNEEAWNAVLAHGNIQILTWMCSKNRLIYQSRYACSNKVTKFNFANLKKWLADRGVTTSWKSKAIRRSMYRDKVDECYEMDKCDECAEYNVRNEVDTDEVDEWDKVDEWMDNVQIEIRELEEGKWE